MSSSFADDVSDVFQSFGLTCSKKKVAEMCADCENYCAACEKTPLVEQHGIDQMGYRQKDRPKMTHLADKDCGCGDPGGKADIVVPAKPKQYF